MIQENGLRSSSKFFLVTLTSSALKNENKGGRTELTNFAAVVIEICSNSTQLKLQSKTHLKRENDDSNDTSTKTLNKQKNKKYQPQFSTRIRTKLHCTLKTDEHYYKLAKIHTVFHGRHIKFTIHDIFNTNNVND